MLKKIAVLFLAAFLAIAPVCLAAASGQDGASAETLAPPADPFNFACKAALLVDSDTGAVLYEKNADAMRSYRPLITAKCGGQLRVPTFINVEANDAVCGEMPYDKLKEWASK